MQSGITLYSYTDTVRFPCSDLGGCALIIDQNMRVSQYNKHWSLRPGQRMRVVKVSEGIISSPSTNFCAKCQLQAPKSIHNDMSNVSIFKRFLLECEFDLHYTFLNTV